MCIEIEIKMNNNLDARAAQYLNICPGARNTRVDDVGKRGAQSTCIALIYGIHLVNFN